MTRKQQGLRHALLALVAVTGIHGAAAADPQRSIVATDRGPVSGVVTSDGRQFLGIPYAAPPIEGLRWQPPRPAPRWSGVLDASQFGQNCPQVASFFGRPSTNEDCLYLNVYTPPLGAASSAGAAAPVMVFIHGGAFAYGEGSDFDPTQLVRRGVIVVTLNYRLGVFGFIGHPELTAESPAHASGNYGLMDQQAALGWVQHNIARFGGDPARVTIFGESAGGLSVHAHLVSPGSAGLFSGAIVQSGAYALVQRPLAAAEADGEALAAAVGCDDLACLRATPAADLVATEDPGQLGYLPNVDGSVLTQSIGPALASGAFTHVPVIEGTTHDEYRGVVAVFYDLAGTPITAADYPAVVAKGLGVPPAVATLIVERYPLSAYSSPDLAFSAIGTDAVFACSAFAVDGWLRAYAPTWVYEFSDQAAPAPLVPGITFPLGAYHSAELQYLFDVSTSLTPPLSAVQEQLSSAMVGYWTEFARRGDPNGASTPAWDRYLPGRSDRVEQLVAPTPRPGTGAAFAADHQCAFWAALSGG
jgi:para-nitrobenzyl esterase